MKQIWFCDNCGVLACTIIQSNTRIHKAAHNIEQDHIKYSPDCTTSVRYIHVLNISEIKSELIYRFKKVGKKK